jgi:DNA-binding FrmR family transcriptional regulator
MTTKREQTPTPTIPEQGAAGDPNLSQQAKTRLRRIEGQVRGLQGMLERLEAEPGCDDLCEGLLTQILAVRAAVEQVGVLIMELHMRRCVLADVAVDEERMRDLRESLKLWTR